MAARLDLHEEFEQEGMKVAPPRTVFSGAQRRPPQRAQQAPPSTLRSAARGRSAVLDQVDRELRRCIARISAAGTGREKWNPCPSVQPRSARNAHSPSVSMPSASGIMPRLLASEIIALTMLAASRSLSTSRMNDRSILRMSTGMCLSRASEE